MRGLTLVELVVVIAMIGIIIALTAPSFSDMIARQRVRGINTELVSDLQYARSEAIQRKTQVRIKLGAGAGFTCYIVYTAEADCACERTPPRCPGAELKTVTVPESTTVRLSATPNQPVTIDPLRGGPLAAAALVAQSTRGMALRTSVTLAGRVESCSFGASPMPGVPAC